MTADDGTWTIFGMPNPKLTCRILPQAEAKLFDELRHYRGRQPPVGAFISQLILKAPQKLWKEVRESMDLRYDDLK